MPYKFANLENVILKTLYRTSEKLSHMAISYKNLIPQQIQINKKTRFNFQKPQHKTLSKQKHLPD